MSFSRAWAISAVLLVACDGATTVATASDEATRDQTTPASESESGATPSEEASGAYDGLAVIGKKAGSSGSGGGASDAGAPSDAGASSDAGSTTDAGSTSDGGAQDAGAPVDPPPPTGGVGRQSPWSPMGVFGSRSCVARPGGSAACWGGRWQNGAWVRDVTPVPVPGLAGAVAVVPGSDHACAILSDTTMRCWGANESGQLGNGSTAASAAPVVVSGLSGVTEAVLGWNGSAARRSDGTVYTWGVWDGYSTGTFMHQSLTAQHAPIYQTATSIDFARVGDSNLVGFAASSTGVREYSEPGYVFDRPLAGIRKISVGAYGRCALLDDATVKCTHFQTAGGIWVDTWTAIAGLTNVTDVVSGFAHTCALREGQVYCWGYNGSGQLGDGTTVTRYAPTLVSGLTGIVSLAARESFHTCAVRNDDAVFCWGSNSEGQIGDGTVINRPTPTHVTF